MRLKKASSQSQMPSSSRTEIEIPCSDELAKFLEHLSAVEGRSVNTIKGYRRDLTDFFSFLHNEMNFPVNAKPSRIMRDDITAYLEYLGRRREIMQGGKIRMGRLSSATLNRRLSAIRRFFRFCVDYGICKANPTADLKGTRQETKLPVFLKVEEVEKLIRSIPGSDLAGLRDRAIVECLYSTGLRVSELVGLNVADFPSHGDTMRVIGKRRKERVVFLGKHAQKAIDNYLDERRASKHDMSADSPLFINLKGGRLSQRSIQRMLADHAKDAGLRVIPTPHSLRHSFATHLVQNGADLRTVQELLGHSKLGTVQIYTHLSLKDLRRRYLDSHPLAKKEID